MPPIPCGTQIHCNYPCNRPPPLCGHPKPVHSCHETEGCPPCPFLTAKICACGKMTLPNVRCSQPKVSCGTSCGKLLPCGFHACQRMCHGDDCGPCESVCGKDRKLWYVAILNCCQSLKYYPVFQIITAASYPATPRLPVQSSTRAKASLRWNVPVGELDDRSPVVVHWSHPGDGRPLCNRSALVNARLHSGMRV